MGYVGRFAPSPSGPLHQGSLFCALVSYLHAKQAGGKWLVRMEDVDETRVKKNADKQIIHQLNAHGLFFDGNIIYQTQRKAAYRKALDSIKQNATLYACTCTRQMIRARGIFYDGHCAEKGHNLDTENTALRLVNDIEKSIFNDEHLGEVDVESGFANEDIVVKRKDGLFSYNLAVVVDDIYQNVSHVVRGADLIDTTIQQSLIYKALGSKPPTYFHLPVLASESGKKLSKQNHAEAVDPARWRGNLLHMAHLLGFDEAKLPLTDSPEALIAHFVSHWQADLLPKQREILLSQTNRV